MKLTKYIYTCSGSGCGFTNEHDELDALIPWAQAHARVYQHGAGLIFERTHTLVFDTIQGARNGKVIPQAPVQRKLPLQGLF